MLHILKAKFVIELIDINDIKPQRLYDSDVIIIGASIRYGKHRPILYELIRENKNLFKKKKTAFFSVNVVARKKEKEKPDTNPYMIKFLTQSKWQPQHLAVFAGKIDYPSLNIFDRYIIKFIMWLTKGPTDTRKRYEFTNWESVKDFAKEITN